MIGYENNPGVDEEKDFRKFSNYAGHQRNFADCVRSRKEPISPFESAVGGDAMVQSADMCLKTKAPVEWDPKKEQLVNHTPALTAMLDRDMREPYGV